MGIIMFMCPSTGKAISTGIEVERAKFNRTPVFIGHTECPICKIDHEWFARDVWVSELDSNDADQLGCGELSFAVDRAFGRKRMRRSSAPCRVQ
jgi:hypothetical protein